MLIQAFLLFPLTNMTHHFYSDSISSRFLDLWYHRYHHLLCGFVDVLLATVTSDGREICFLLNHKVSTGKILPNSWECDLITVHAGSILWNVHCIVDPIVCKEPNTYFQGMPNAIPTDYGMWLWETARDSKLDACNIGYLSCSELNRLIKCRNQCSSSLFNYLQLDYFNIIMCLECI